MLAVFLQRVCYAPPGKHVTMNASQQSMIQEYLPLVRRVALHVASRLPSQVELCDLTQAGFLGLVDAAVKYDVRKGVRFWTYAELRIRGSILDSLRALDWLPRSVRRRRRELDTASARLECRLGRAPSDAELASELEVSTNRLREIVEKNRYAELSAERVGGVDDVEVFVRDPNGKDPHDLLERRELVALLVRAVEGLDERDRLVMSLYYHEELTMKEIGEVLGVNESRVSQIHSKAVRTLRARIDSHLHPRRPALLDRTA